MSATILTGNVHAGVVEGQRLSEAMRRESVELSGAVSGDDRGGRRGGDLMPLITERLAALLERQAEMRGKIDRRACLSGGAVACCHIGRDGTDGIGRAPGRRTV